MKRGVNSRIISANEYVDLNENGKINTNPLYQREFVWGEEQQNSFLETMIYEEFFMAQMIANEPSGGVWNTIDGKQKTETLGNFVRNEIPCEHEGNHIYYDTVPAGKKGRVMTEEEKDSFDSKMINITMYTGLSYDEEELIYLLHHEGVVAGHDDVVAHYIRDEENRKLLMDIISKHNRILANHLDGKARDNPRLFVMQILKLLIDDSDNNLKSIQKSSFGKIFEREKNKDKIRGFLEEIDRCLTEIGKVDRKNTVTNYAFMIMLYRFVRDPDFHITRSSLKYFYTEFTKGGNNNDSSCIENLTYLNTKTKDIIRKYLDGKNLKSKRKEKKESKVEKKPKKDKKSRSKRE